LKRSNELHVQLGTGATTALVYRAEADATASLILAHGAGAGQRSAFMMAFAKGIAALGVDVITFDFEYITAKRRVPDRGPALEACYLSVIATVREAIESSRQFLFIGGKSMGGRIATQVAAADEQLPIAGLVLLGYPLHPPGRPLQLRAAHLPSIPRPMLFVQGSRDTFGTPSELRPVLNGMVPTPTLHVVDAGDHSLKVSRDPRVQATAYDDVQRTMVQWMQSVIER
jgi:predicted alpha/beta-hydrolase family hydrolase